MCVCVCVCAWHTSQGPEVDSDDNEATDDLLEFITHMLTHVYPHLQDRDFFIAGVWGHAPRVTHPCFQVCCLAQADATGLQ